MKFDVVGFGALNVDRLFKVNRIARENEESYVLSCFEDFGGSAANTIVGLARVGLKTGFVGKVGDDQEGAGQILGLQREGVDTSGIVVGRGERSGMVLGFIDGEGNRALYVIPGANDTLTSAEVDVEYVRNAKFLHITSFVGPKPFSAQKRLVNALRGEVNVSFDPGEIYAQRGLRALRPIVRCSYVVLLNERELLSLTGLPLEKGVEKLLREGVSILAVKLGSRGCYVTNGRESHLIKPFEVEVRDTTGAGDAFNAGFLFGLIKGKDLFECGRLGNFFAAKKIAEFGARRGLPRSSDVEELNRSQGLSQKTSLP